MIRPADTLSALRRFSSWSTVLAALIENAVDAGAATITVTITSEGLVVRDDGRGLTPERWALAQTRFACCDIPSNEDLATVGLRFGLLGESLALLRSVATVVVDGWSQPRTVIAVRDLRGPNGEHLELDGDELALTAARYALACPAAAITVTDETRTRGSKLWSEAGELQARVEALLTRSERASLRPLGDHVLSETGELLGSITGWICGPQHMDTTTDRLALAINGHVLRPGGPLLDRVLEPYQALGVARGSYPLGFLRIQLDPQHLNALYRPPRPLEERAVWRAAGKAVWAALSEERHSGWYVRPLVRGRDAA